MSSLTQIKDHSKKTPLVYFVSVIHYFLLLFFSGISIIGYSQRNPFRIYTVQDGLLNLQPQAIFQDDDGFMWFGGIEGISIYDGNRFTNFPSENKGPRMNYLYNFFQRNRDEVWALYSDGIEVFINRKFKETLPIVGINHMLRTRDKRILAAGKGGIYELIKDKLNIVFPSKNSFDRIYEVGNYFLACQVPRQCSILFDHTFHVIDVFRERGTFLTNASNFWWFSEGSSKVKLLDTLTLHKKGVIRLVGPPVALNNITDDNLSYPFTDSEGFVWVTSKKGVIRIDKDGGIRKFSLSNGLGTNFATGYFEDYEGNVWLQTDGYIKFFDKTVDIFSKNEGLSSSSVYSIAADRYHNIWIAQQDGISNLKKNSIYKFNFPRNAKSGEGVPRIAIRGDSLWLVYHGLWLYKIHYDDRPQIEFRRKWLSWHQKRIVYAGEIRIYKDGTPLVNFNGGLYYLNRGGQIQRLTRDSLYFTFFTSGDELWGAPFNYGVTRWRVIEEPAGLELKLVKQYDTIPGLRVLSIAKDSYGNIWAGTLYKGVIKFEKQREDSFLLRSYTSQSGLRGGGIVFDRAGEMYTYTGSGFYILHPYDDSIYAENVTDKYGFYGNLWDMTETPNGDLWLATETGAVRIRKMEDKKKMPPKIFITGMQCNNNPDTSFVADNKTRSFSYKQNNFSFEFTATSFKNEAEVLYSYQLRSGAGDTTWSQPKKIHQVSFAALAPGHYTFKVKALTTDDQWSKSPAEYSFVITSPYYETWWFRATIILFVITVVSALYRYRLSQVKKLLALRTRISRDLHDEIGSALTSINILSKVSSTNLEKDSSKTSHLLEQITEQSQDIQQSMSDIVWAIRPDNDKLENIAIRMREYLGQVAEAKDLKIDFRLDDKALKETLSMQQRKDLFLIFKEAVNNAVKYSGGRKIIVLLAKENRQIKLSVQDDGIGFSEANATSSSGLKNMRDRARNLKGRLRIQSSPGSGTVVEFIGPAT